MAEKVTKRLSKAIDPKKEDFVEFIVSRPQEASSATMIRATGGLPELIDPEPLSLEAGQAAEAGKYSPAFLSLRRQLCLLSEGKPAKMLCSRAGFIFIGRTEEYFIY